MKENQNAVKVSKNKKNYICWIILSVAIITSSIIFFFAYGQQNIKTDFQEDLIDTTSSEDSLTNTTISEFSPSNKSVNTLNSQKFNITNDSISTNEILENENSTINNIIIYYDSFDERESFLDVKSFVADDNFSHTWEIHDDETIKKNQFLDQRL